MSEEKESQHKIPKHKPIYGPIVIHDGQEYVVVEYLGGMDVVGCKIRNGRVFWRTQKFLGSDWESTKKERIKIKREGMKIDSMPDKYNLHL